jgi:1-acyl-sn-glycerol-3-phosphate acyltransferase
MVLYLRSLLFWILFALTIPVFSVALLLTFPLPLRSRFSVTSVWTRLIVGWLAFTCNLRHEVQGLENIPAEPGIVLAKHQSTWETVTLNFWFTPQSWVIKRELMWIPFFGWGAYMMHPIALNRGAGRRAVDQLVEQGRARLVQGHWIIIFPEGTRVEAGRRGNYRIGGAVLAVRTGRAVTPVAHNAGEYWPRRSFVKRPGVIRVRIGPPIDTRDKTPQQVMAETENWIEAEMANITTLPRHEHGERAARP